MFKDNTRGIETDICFDSLVPMPKELKDTLHSGDNYNWYNWRISNWGVQWDVEARIVSESGNVLIYEFGSQCGPPGAWIRKIALMFPDLSFKLCYKESEMCFQGTMLAQKDLFIDEREDYFEEMDVLEEEQCELCEDVQEIISIAKRE